MNTRLMTLSLIVLLGLGSMGASGSIPPGQQKKLLDQQNQALVQEELTLGQTYRQLLDQKRAVLEQLRALNPKGGTTQDWQDLWENYLKYKDADDDEDDYEDNYKDKLKALRPKGVDKDAFKSKAEALLKALQAVQQQQDALEQSQETHDQKVQQLNQTKKDHTQKTGKN